MTRRLAMIALLAVTGLASCDRGGGAAPATVEVSPDPAPTPALANDSAVPAAATRSAAVPPSPPASAGDAIQGAPGFAVVYPGGVVETTPLTTVPTGGGVVFTTEASPDEIVAFYRARAEEAGLASVMSMSQGETRGYGAAGAPGGAGLQVVAHPIAPGQTSVQVTWTAGQ